jgi:D-alanyl-D-alanine dipeptidase
MKTEPKLALPHVPARLQYPLRGYSGSLSAPWLEVRVSRALESADKRIQRISEGRARILVWDALRTRECQLDIWKRYAEILRIEHPALCENEVQAQVAKFVSNPTGVFRHGTGGAVDVTLLVSGLEADMGTAFDEFTPIAAADYFRVTPHTTERDRKVHTRREMLRSAMEAEGFVVLPDEWWHYELGTAMWGDHYGVPPFLTTVVDPPQADPYPAQVLVTSKSMPTLTTSVAQAFATTQQRRAALSGDAVGHYYARTSTPSRTQLERCLTTI